MNKVMMKFKKDETPTVAPVEASDTRTKNSTSKETRGYIVPQVNLQRQVAHISRTVKNAIGKFIAGDIVFIDLTVMPQIGDIALLCVGGRESLEVYKGQGNLIGKVTHKWWAE